MENLEDDKRVNLTIDIDALKSVALKERKYSERVSCALVIRMLTVVPGEATKSQTNSAMIQKFGPQSWRTEL